MIFEAELPFAEGRDFIKRWHYSASMPKGSHLMFGWRKNSGELYAVADYGNGVNPYQATYLSKLLDMPVGNSGYVELKRLARSEPRLKRRQLSQFLSMCHRSLRRSGVKVVIAFADPEYGHEGGVYRASNFRYAGTTQAEMHVVDMRGRPVHRRVAYRHARARGISIGDARAELFLFPVKTLPKHRWVITL